MVTPTMASAANPYDIEAAMWADLPVIEPLEIDFAQFPELAELAARSAISLPDGMRADAFDPRIASHDGMDALSELAMMEAFAALTAEEQLVTMEEAEQRVPRNELSEPSPEELEEILRIRMGEAIRSQDYNLQDIAEFAQLLEETSTFSALDENGRDLIFRKLDIAPEATDITLELFALMERDGFTLADSIELVRLMASGLLGYAEAQTILASMPSSQERLLEVMHLERFAQGFDIADEVNARRLANQPFVSTHEFDVSGGRAISDIAVFTSSIAYDEPYSFIEATQAYGRAKENSVFAAFTNSRAWDEALMMFIAGHSVAEIEMAFSLGAALQVEPETFLLQPGASRTMSLAQLAGEMVSPQSLRMPQEGHYRTDVAMETRLRTEEVDTEAESTSDSYSLLEELLAYGRSILNFAPLSNLPPLVVNPFTINISANESVSLNTGASVYRTHILSLPGRGGFGFNLDLLYTSARADFRRMTPTSSWARRNLHGLGAGWIFDLLSLL